MLAQNETEMEGQFNNIGWWPDKHGAEAASETKQVMAALPTEDLKEIRIAMVGKTGVGKSKVGNNLLQRKAFKSSSCGNSVTSKCQFGNRMLEDGYKLVVVDTPGLFGTRMKKTEISNELARCVLLTSPGPHVFLFVLAVGRFTNEEHETIKNLKDIFGEQVMNFVVILFTCKDTLICENRMLDEYLSKCPEAVKSIIKESSGRCVAINNIADPGNLKNDVEDLLKVVRETIQSNRAQCYTGEMYVAAEKVLKEKMQKIEEEKHKRERELDEKERKLKKEINEQTQKLEEEMTKHRLKEVENQRKNEEEKQKLEKQRENERKKLEIEEKNKKLEEERALEVEKKHREFEKRAEQEYIKQKKRELEHQKMLEAIETEIRRMEQLRTDKEQKEKKQQDEENKRKEKKERKRQEEIERNRVREEQTLEREKMAMRAAEREQERQMEKEKAEVENQMMEKKYQQEIEKERQRLEQQRRDYEQRHNNADTERRERQEAENRRIMQKQLDKHREEIRILCARDNTREDEARAKNSRCSPQ